MDIFDRTQVAEIPSGSELGTSQPLGEETWQVNPRGWTKDGNGIYFIANPGNQEGFYKQDLNTGETQLIVALPSGFLRVEITSDQKWLLYTQESEKGGSSTKPRLMRMPLSGGMPEVILEGSFSYKCVSQANRCLLMESNGPYRTFYVLDPAKGEGPKFIATDQAVPNWSWRLAPDGKSIAYISGDDSKILLLNQAGGVAAIPIEIKGVSFRDLRWSSDSQHLFVAARSQTQKPDQILRLDLGGKFRPIFGADIGQHIDQFGVSPDERHLFYSYQSYQTNVVMLEHF